MRSILFSLFLLVPLHVFAQHNTVLEWRFDSPGSWKGWSTNHLSGVHVDEGVLSATMSEKDPFLVTPPIDIKADRWYAVEMRIKTNANGKGDLFFTNTTEGKYGGFDNAKRVDWQTLGDGRWHEYRIFPFWEAQKKIVKFRIDFPNLKQPDIGKKTAEIAWIRVVDLGTTSREIKNPEWDFRKISDGFAATENMKVDKSQEGWTVTKIETNAASGAEVDTVEDAGFLMSEPFKSNVDDCGYYVCIEMKGETKGKGTIRFATDKGSFVDVSFPLAEVPVYNIDMSRNKDWDGNIRMLGLKISDQPGAAALVKRISISEKPQGPACIVIDKESLGLVNASNRVGQNLPFEIRGTNVGGETAKFKIDFQLPPGLTLAPAEADSLKNEVIEVEPGDQFKKRVVFRANKQVDGAVIVTTHTSSHATFSSAAVKIGPSLNLPKADYVPEPKPVTSQYDIGALYFPGWEFRRAWDRVEPVAPIRKPMLGWYDEANVECIDWQIKWAVENGINTFYVDWYWNLGHRHHEHWIEGFKKARYRKYLKYAIMWANHNKAESHDFEDQKAVTEYWCKNFFNDPQYERIDGKPVVWIWSAQLMDEGIAAIEAKKGNSLKKGEGVKRLLGLSRKIAEERGFKGIYFIAMKFPEAGNSPEDVQWLADAGFDMTSIYHFMIHGNKAKDPRYFDFKLVAEASLPWWKERHKTGILPFMPNLSTGWDDRPWNNRTVIYGRTPELFRQICNDYKKFAGETGIKKLCLAPLNEWGEGSYIEPNREFGFAMYEQIRESLCEKPANGWPLNYAPTDVGLGPYDLPEQESSPRRTSWDFKTGEQGWKPLMGVDSFKVAENRLTFRTNHHDPAIMTPLEKVAAKDVFKIVVRMKQTPAPIKGDVAQLFWTNASMQTSEERSVKVPLQHDDEFHDYVFHVGESRSWKGIVGSLRFDPVGRKGIAVEIESIRMESR